MNENMESILQIIRSPTFDCFSCLQELSKHGKTIGIQFVLVERLKAFPYSELEFFIPQLIQVLVSFESESMALHDMILDMSRKFPHFCLLTFWNLQAYVSELKGQPDSYSFHVVRNFINNLQDIMFNEGNGGNEDSSFRENCHPALVLCAAVGASFGLPGIHQYTRPLVISQGKQQKSLLFKLANFHGTLTKNLTLKNRGVSDNSASGSVTKSDIENKASFADRKRYSESVLAINRSDSRDSEVGFDSEAEDIHYNSDYSQDHNVYQSRTLHCAQPLIQRTRTVGHLPAREPALVTESKERKKFASHSMPDLFDKDFSGNHVETIPMPTSSSLLSENLESTFLGIDSKQQEMSDDSKKWVLKANYYRKETEFMMVLQNISSALSQVPKEARLTSLRAELSIINSSLLPSQIDIPQLFPASNFPNRKYHRILKLNISEACVLNSAERVPYLLLIEYLSEDMDFDPYTDYNRKILSSSNSKGNLGVRSLDKSFSDKISAAQFSNNDHEADLGDISVVALSNQRSHFSDYLRANMSKSGSVWEPSDEAKVGSRMKKNHKTSREEVSKGTIGKTKDLSAQIRIAAVMLKQLEKSGQANSEQSAAIKSRIISSMKVLQDQFDSIDYQQIREISSVHDSSSEPDAGDRKIENDFKIGEDWATKRSRIRKTSAYGHLPNWDLCSVIVKNGDDLQQEAFACQLISVISNAWKADNIGVWTKSMKIVITSVNSGLVETINNALSVHSIKKTMTELSIKSGENPKGVVASIRDYFTKIYGPESDPKHVEAQECFARSLAAYSIICYVLQIKDRHNGNIMLDNEGHIIHIDFGFMLSNSPGSVGFEAAPFKLTSEYIEVLGGAQSQFFELFVRLCQECFLSLRRQFSQLVNLVNLMQKDSTLPCFKNGPQTTVLLKQRLHLDLSDEDCRNFVETNLIAKSAGSVYTRLYDQFQLLTQGIYN